MYSVKKIVPIIFGVLVLISLSGYQFTPTMIQSTEAEPSKRIVGYFPYWESADIDSIDYTKLTDIIYFHIWPNADGTLDTSAVNINDLQTIRDRAHAAGVNIIISAGGGQVSDGFPIMASDVTSRAIFVSNVEQFISNHNLDGIDIDWETPINPTKIDNQDILLADLSNTLHPLGKSVTVAANGEVVELKSSATNYVDWVNVMAYDMNWGSAEHSNFTDSISALQRYENVGIPKEKLSLGIPFYGRDSNTNAIKYENIVSDCNPQPSDNYCNDYFFNGIDLVQNKTQYVLDNNYHGIMIWNLGQDTYNETSLLNAINEILVGQDNTVYLENLEIVKSGNKRWTATVTMTVFGENNATISGADVRGTWSGSSNDLDSCVTNSIGKCSVSKSTRGDSLTFTVDDILGSSITYQPNLNNVGNSITINKDGSIPGQNSPPIADAGGSYTSTINSTIIFDGSGSTDPDGDIMTYDWEFGDGVIGEGINPAHAYSLDGIYNLSLTVTDPNGEYDTDFTIVTISTLGNTGLTITQILPNSMIKGDTITILILGTGFENGSTVGFSGAGSAPSMLDTRFVDETTIEVDLFHDGKGPKRDLIYDVTVTNLNGESVTSPNVFTVIN